jgi:uncharacterized surface protein with fasciclin (FAS1) repeats
MFASRDAPEGKSMQALQPKAVVGDGSRDIVDTVIALGKFSILSNAFRATRLVETLKGPGPFTLFAPTDEAFRKLPAGTLDALLKDKVRLGEILSCHLLPGKLMKEDLAPGDFPTTAGGTLKMAIVSDVLMADDARVTKADIEASNGMIHLIDAVVMPKRWASGSLMPSEGKA